MLYFASVTEMAYTVADIMEDVWHSRHYLRDTTYLVYRLDATDVDSDTTVNIYIHYLVTKERWYARVSQEPTIAQADLTARLSDEKLMDMNQCTSWRHYAFQDLVRHFVEKEAEDIIARKGVKEPRLTLWNTFPAELC